MLSDVVLRKMGDLLLSIQNKRKTYLDDLRLQLQKGKTPSKRGSLFLRPKMWLKNRYHVSKGPSNLGLIQGSI